MNFSEASKTSNLWQFTGGNSALQFRRSHTKDGLPFEISFSHLKETFIKNCALQIFKPAYLQQITFSAAMSIWLDKILPQKLQVLKNTRWKLVAFWIEQVESTSGRPCTNVIGATKMNIQKMFITHPLLSNVENPTSLSKNRKDCFALN